MYYDDDEVTISSQGEGLLSSIADGMSRPTYDIFGHFIDGHLLFALFAGAIFFFFHKGGNTLRGVILGGSVMASRYVIPPIMNLISTYLF